MKTKKLTLAGILIALAVVLSFVKIFDAPFGGSVTAGSMVPIILFALMSDVKWGLLMATVYGGIQMIVGGVAPPAQTFISFFVVILLDYIVAFGVLGFSGAISRKLGGKTVGAAASTLIVLFLRFLCHFVSGILIWGVYAPEGQAVWLYSLLYNGGYMLGETIITTILVLLIKPRIKA
ncbi:MAG: energy-coupled thiamine transporter ThiT [Monoglobales bacterium]